MSAEDRLEIGKHTFRSRLFVGTGKYASVAQTRDALEASGAEVVTVALRRVNLEERGEGSLMQLLMSGRWTILPNTAAIELELDKGLPIGSGLGIRNPYNLRIILEQIQVPVIVDAGVGTASDAAVALELGCHGVLMNTAIAEARDPVLMAAAMREAVSAGRKAFLAGRMPRRLYANASSPTAGLIE